MKYRSDIDGLRGIAVASVVLFHAFPELLPGGFVGVDIFFVISGFLITGIIIEGVENGTFTFANFYGRRIRRIFPSLLVILLLSCAVGWFTLLSSEFIQLGKHIAAGAGFLSNFALWGEAGYFDTGEALKPLLHLWSLGVEEQFYIIWPPALILAHRAGLSRRGVILSLLLISFGANLQHLWTNDSTAAFYSPVSRFWELLFGALLADISRKREAPLAAYPTVVASVGLSLLLTGLVLIDETSRFPGFWALLPVIGATLVMAVGPHGWINRHILADKRIVWVGLISYPLYLWHWPILSFGHIVRGKTPIIGFRIGAIIASVALSYITYRFLEREIRFNKAGRYVVPLATVMFLTLALGLAAFSSAISPRNSGHALENIVKAANEWDFPGQLQEYPYKGSVFHKQDGNADKIVLIGDSHVQQYGPRVEALGAEAITGRKTVIMATNGGCSPIEGVHRAGEEDLNAKCEESRANAYDLAASPDISSVLVGGCWNCYFLTSDSFLFLDESGATPLTSPKGQDMGLAALENKLTALSKSRKVYLLLDNPVGRGFDPMSYFEGTRLRGLSVSDMPERVAIDPAQEALRRKLVALALRAGAVTIDPVLHLCENGDCLVRLTDGRPVYKDKTHYRPFFAREYCGFIDEAITIE